MSKNNSDPSELADGLSQMQALSQAINANFQLQDVASSMLELRQQLIKTMEPMLQSQIQSGEMLRNLSLSLTNVAQPLLSNFRIQIENLINPALEDFLESFRLLLNHTQEALLTLGSHGWFFDLEMPLPFLWELENTLNEGEIKEAETTPIFLAQTDGICYEVVYQHLFMRVRGEKKPSTAIFVDTIASDTFRHALLSPLSQPLPISASKGERDESFNELIRHQVMHGESLVYGTEINSLKSIFLLNYVTQVLRLDDEDEQCLCTNSAEIAPQIHISLP